ncbi:MAG: hypothetical protein ABSC19_15800 [Syntrophorhabdales bacterium]|jgi:hypothetical protein
MWIAILKRQVEQKGAKQVAYELGIGRSTVSLLCQRKYPAGTKKMEERIEAIYGKAGTIDCPVLGGIDPSTCVNCWTKAKKIGMKASNPETLRLYKTCTSCTARGG